MEKYRELLQSAGADDWEILEQETTGWEFYFVRDRLDQNRAKKVKQITLKAYKRGVDGDWMGSALATVSPDESDEALEKIIKDLVIQASLVRNKPYTLHAPRACSPLNIPEYDLSSQAALFLAAMRDIPQTKSAYLNSYEIFISRERRHFLTSRGIDITQCAPSAMLDLVVNAGNESKQIELYRLLTMGACDPAKLTREITQLMTFGQDRLQAVPTPAGLQVPVLLSTDAAVSVYSYFLDQLNAAFLVRGLSAFKLGVPIAETFSGDRVTLETARYLEGSPVNFAYDAEGAPILDQVLLKEGVPCAFVGNRMFSQYLGLEESFIVSNWKVTGGTKSEQELRTGPYLEVVEFSDFQVDAMTGDLFGEIRLAYYHDAGGRILPVTGGSLSGNMADNISSMRMSKESRQYSTENSSAVIPALTKLEHVTIAGVGGKD